MSATFIHRVRIRNYKSIASADVQLNELVFLLGRNGAGKSNFLDALRFISDALKTYLDHALRERGTIREVRRRSGGHPNHFSIRVDFHLPGGDTGHYSFRIGAKPAGGFIVQDEECVVDRHSVEKDHHFFRVKEGELLEASFAPAPTVVSDRLYLVMASGVPPFGQVFEALSRIEVYNLNPKEIASMQQPDPGEILRRDGSNAASVLQRLDDPSRDLVNSHLKEIVSGIMGAETKTLGGQETIEFRQKVRGQANPWRFLAGAMSDGTLRALAILIAIFQAGSKHQGAHPPLLIGIEEPEIALHPAAAKVLLGALREGARFCQILVTSHSPDLLDFEDIEPESLLSVDNVDSLTRIGPIDSTGKDMLRQKLFTAGELLRQDQIQADESAAFDARERQLRLFEKDGGQ